MKSLKIYQVTLCVIVYVVLISGKLQETDKEINKLDTYTRSSQNNEGNFVVPRL